MIRGWECDGQKPFVAHLVSGADGLKAMEFVQMQDGEIIALTASDTDIYGISMNAADDGDGVMVMKAASNLRVHITNVGSATPEVGVWYGIDVTSDVHSLDSDEAGVHILFVERSYTANDGTTVYVCSIVQVGNVATGMVEATT